MADKRISELNVAEELGDAALIPMEQNGQAVALPGHVLRKFVTDAVDNALGDYATAMAALDDVIGGGDV